MLHCFQGSIGPRTNAIVCRSDVVAHGAGWFDNLCIHVYEHETVTFGSNARACDVNYVRSVRRSYSARVSKSSLAGVHWEFVHHILEDEVDGQEEEQDDKREDAEQRERGKWSSPKESEQTHEDDT